MRPHDERSASAPLSIARSASTSAHALGSARSVSKLAESFSKKRRRSSASAASSTSCDIGRPVASASRAKRSRVCSLTLIVVLISEPVYRSGDRSIYGRLTRAIFPPGGDEVAGARQLDFSTESDPTTLKPASNELPPLGDICPGSTLQTPDRAVMTAGGKHEPPRSHGRS